MKFTAGELAASLDTLCFFPLLLSYPHNHFVGCSFNTEELVYTTIYFVNIICLILCPFIRSLTAAIPSHNHRLPSRYATMDMHTTRPPHFHSLRPVFTSYF